MALAFSLCAALVAASAQERLGLWVDLEPEGPDAPVPPDKKTYIAPYAPAPGRDDRTPLVFMNQVFDLKDPDLPSMLSGIGSVYWKHNGRGTGALIAPNVVLTTAHLFVAKGDWKGANGAVPVPPAPSNGFIYLEACAEAYHFASIEVGSESPRSRLGLDYAIGVLDRPACAEATILPVSETPEDLEARARDEAIILSMGSWAFTDLPRYAQHPLFTARTSRNGGPNEQAVFGVRCRITGSQDTGDVTHGSTGIIVTEGCDGVPGGSGGPLLLSEDGGATYSVVGVANSYRPNSEYNNYTRIEGAFSDHLQRHLRIKRTPPFASAAASLANELGVLKSGGLWLPM